MLVTSLKQPSSTNEIVFHDTKTGAVCIWDSIGLKVFDSLWKKKAVKKHTLHTMKYTKIICKCLWPKRVLVRKAVLSAYFAIYDVYYIVQKISEQLYTIGKFILIIWLVNYLIIWRIICLSKKKMKANKIQPFLTSNI